MNTQERESASNSRGGGGGGGGGDRRAERSGESVPSTSDSTNNIHPSSAPPTTTSEPTNKPTTMGPKPTNATNSGQRSSSTESEGPGRREYGKDRRPPPRQSDDDEEDDEEDDEGEEEARHSSEGSSGGGGAGAGGTGSDGSSSAVHPSLGSSSTSGSPVRRLPQMLRPPPGHATQQPSPSQQQQTPTSTPIYGGGGIAQATRSSMPHYYGGGGLGTASPRDPTSSPGGGGPLENGGGRVLAQKRRLQQQSNEYLSPSSPSLPPPHPQPQQQPLNPSARAMYETSQHHSSSNSSSSTARSGGGVGLGMNTNNHHHHNNTHANHHRAPDDDDDDDNEDPLRFETRGSHGPRDEARYETWTSKQLRKKCSHLKLRGLKNVKKHVMVEALYRYYRNQRTKTGNDGGGGNAGTSNSANHIRNSSGSVTHNNNGGRAVSSTRNDSSAMYDERYGQQQHRYEHAMNASTTSSSYMTNSTGMGVRSSRPSMGSGNPSASLNPSMQPQTRRSAPLSISQPTRQSMRHSAGGSLPGGTYTSALDLEESKYDNEVRITSEDVIRLVDVILSPEFVDRLSTELSKWQFWVDVREKYFSLAAMNGPSSYGAARGLTALGGDHHSQSGDRGGGGSNSGIDNTRLPITASYMRPSAKWSSMQLWEMWKELTFAYTKTCFEFTAAGVDERNYIQFCEGRPDVYYLHQRLHARPDLLHLIKSNEYIEEKCSSDAASEHTNMNAEKNAANALMGVGSPVTQSRPHKRFKRIVPAASNGGDRQPVGGSGGLTASQTYGGGGTTTPGTYSTGAGGNGVSGGMTVGTGAASGGNAGVNANAIGSEGATPPQMAASNSSGGGSSGGGGGSGGSGGGPAQYLASNGMHVGTTISPSGQQEEGSTENSETTGEEGSLEKSNSNATSDSTRREALAEQKYFGLLLQNFEAIFESLHNKKVLLAALRKDNSAPDHLIADLHDDIHVLSALKKDFRNKLHQALE